MLEPKSYEKIYSVREIQPREDEQIAVIEMTAATSEEPIAAEDEMKVNEAIKRLDSSDTYSGKLILNLTTGKVEKYTERLDSTWIASEDKGEKGTDVLTMGFGYKYSLEKIK